jgi:molybdenum cofactor cytidylyltransferase
MLRSYGIVPAAGRSVRMGTPKLLLPWRERPVIHHVLAAWTAAVDRVVVVIRGEDEALASACGAFDVDIVSPRPSPVDMKASVQAALRHLEAKYRPRAEDVCLLAPADVPRLSTGVIEQLIRAHDSEQPAAILPVFEGERGHPLLLPWQLAQRVHGLAPHEGVSAVLNQVAVREVMCHDRGIVEDLDTDADYARLVSQSA